MVDWYYVCHQETILTLLDLCILYYIVFCYIKLDFSDLNFPLFPGWVKTQSRLPHGGTTTGEVAGSSYEAGIQTGRQSTETNR